MTHPSHRRAAAPPVRYQWCGHQAIHIVKAGPVAADVQLMCPSAGTSLQQSTVTIEKIFVRLLTHRILASELDAFGYMVAIQETVPTTGLSITVLNPLEVTVDNFALALKQLLMTGLVGWPPVLLKADDTSKENSSGMLYEVEFNGRRKMNRLNHALTMTLETDVDAVLRVFVQTRVLLRMT